MQKYYLPIGKAGRILR